MTFKRNHEGYLLIDNRDSPGVSAEFVRASGQPAPIVGPGQTFESATITCAHCNAIVILNPLRTRPRNYCAKCDAYVCDSPWCASNCRPFARLLEDAYNQAQRNISGGQDNG